MKKNQNQGERRPCTLVSGTLFQSERCLFSAGGMPCRMSKGSHLETGQDSALYYPFCATAVGPQLPMLALDLSATRINAGSSVGRKQERAQNVVL